MESFIAGFAYGATTVVVGQPLDTIKTRMQAMDSSKGAFNVAKDLVQKEGISGLYRGGFALLLGGGLMRSAQFGVYNSALNVIKNAAGGPTAPESKIFGLLDYQVVIAGFCGGIGRGIVEGPFENMKVRRQVGNNWSIRELYIGSGTTIFRNSILFSLFVIYMDISKQVVQGGLGPFLTGSTCATLAWLSVWPLDVIKSQIQSGSYKGKNAWHLLRQAYTSGALYRGLAPGLTRSAIANGLSMMVYTKTENYIKQRYPA